MNPSDDVAQLLARMKRNDRAAALDALNESLARESATATKEYAEVAKQWPPAFRGLSPLSPVTDILEASAVAYAWAFKRRHAPGKEELLEQRYADDLAAIADATRCFRIGSKVRTEFFDAMQPSDVGAAAKLASKLLVTGVEKGGLQLEEAVVMAEGISSIQTAIERDAWRRERLLALSATRGAVIVATTEDWLKAEQLARSLNNANNNIRRALEAAIDLKCGIGLTGVDEKAVRNTLERFALTDFAEAWQRTPYSPGVEAKLRNLASAFQKRQKSDESLTFAMRTVAHFLFQYVAENRNRQIARSPAMASSAERDAHVTERLSGARSSALRDSHSILEAAIRGDRLARARLARRNGLLEEVAKQRMAAASTYRPQPRMQSAEVVDEPDDAARATLNTAVELPKMPTRAIADLWLQTVVLKHADEERIARFLWDRTPHAITRNRGFGGDSRARMHKLYDTTGVVDRKHPWFHRNPRDANIGSSHGEKTEGDDVPRHVQSLDELLDAWLSALVHSSGEIEEARARELWSATPRQVTGGHDFDGVSRHIMFASMTEATRARFIVTPPHRASSIFCGCTTCVPCVVMRSYMRSRPRDRQLASSHGEITEGDDVMTSAILRETLDALYVDEPQLREFENAATAMWARLGMESWTLSVELDLPEEPILARIAWAHTNNHAACCGPGECGVRFDRATRVRLAVLTGQDFETVARLMRRPYLRGAPGGDGAAPIAGQDSDSDTGLIELAAFATQGSEFVEIAAAAAGQTVTIVGPGVSHTWRAITHVELSGLYMDRFAQQIVHRELFVDAGSCPELFARLMRFYRIPVLLTHKELLEYEVRGPSAVISSSDTGGHVSAIVRIAGKLVHIDTGAHGCYAFKADGEAIEHCVIADQSQARCAFVTAYALLSGAVSRTFTLDDANKWVSRFVGPLRVAAALTRNPKLMITGFKSDGSFAMADAIVIRAHQAPGDSNGAAQPTEKGSQTAAVASSADGAKDVPPSVKVASAGSKPSETAAFSAGAPAAQSPQAAAPRPDGNPDSAQQPVPIGRLLVHLTRTVGLHICRVKLAKLKNPIHRRAVRCYVRHAMRLVGEESRAEEAFQHFLAHADIEEDAVAQAALEGFHATEPITELLAEGFSNAAFAAREQWYAQNGWLSAKPIVDETIQALRELELSRISAMWTMLDLFPDDPPAMPVEPFTLADEVFGYSNSDDAFSHTHLIDRTGKRRIHHGRIGWERARVGSELMRRWAGCTPDTFEYRAVAPQFYQGRGMAYVAVVPQSTVAEGDVRSSVHTTSKDYLAGRMRVPHGAARRIMESVARVAGTAVRALRPDICLEAPSYGMSEEGFVFKWVSDSPAISEPAVNTREPHPTWAESVARALVPTASELTSVPMVLGCLAALRRYSPVLHRVAVLLGVLAMLWRIAIRFQKKRWCHRVIVDRARSVTYVPNQATQHGQKDLMPNTLADVTHITWPDGCLDVTQRSSQTWRDQEVRPALSVNLGACGDSDTFRQRLRSRIDETIRSHRTLQNADVPSQRLAAPVVATAVLQTQYQVAAFRPMLRGPDLMLSGYHHGLFETKTKEPDDNFSAIVIRPEREITAPEAVYTAIRLRRTDKSTALPGYRNASIGQDQKIVAAAMRVGQRMPPIDPAFAEACARFARQFNASIEPLDPLDAKNHEEWVKRYGNARAGQLYSAAASTTIKQLSRCKSFIKRETTTKPGIPRAINAYNDHSKMYLGWLVSSIEKRLFALDHFVKGRPVAQIGEMLQRKFGDVPVVTTDYTAFECHHRAEYAEIFVAFIEHMTSRMDAPAHAAMITDLVRAVNVIDYGDVQCEIPQRLMSGALWTSLQNTYMNLVFAGTLTQLKLESQGAILTAPQVLSAFPMVFEGDDGMMVDIGQDLTIGEAGGLILKAERHASITTAGFCCQHVVPGLPDIVCNPEKVLRKLYAVDGLYAGARERTQRAVLRAKALSYLSMYPRGPVVAAACHHVLRRTANARPTTTIWRLTRPYAFNGSYDVSDAALLAELASVEAAAAQRQAIPDAVRDACTACFGLSVDTQLDMERAFECETDDVRWDFDEWQRPEDDVVSEYLLGEGVVDTRRLTMLPEALRAKTAYGATGFRSRLTRSARQVDEVNGHQYANRLLGRGRNTIGRARICAADEEEQRRETSFRNAGLGRSLEGQSRISAKSCSENNFHEDDHQGRQTKEAGSAAEEGEATATPNEAHGSRSGSHCRRCDTAAHHPARNSGAEQFRLIHARSARHCSRVARTQERPTTDGVYGQSKDSSRDNIDPVSRQDSAGSRGEVVDCGEPARRLALRRVEVREGDLGLDALQHHRDPGESLPPEQPIDRTQRSAWQAGEESATRLLQRRPAVQPRHGRRHIGLGHALLGRRVQDPIELRHERQRFAVSSRIRGHPVCGSAQHTRSGLGEAQHPGRERQRPDGCSGRRHCLDRTRRCGFLQRVQGRELRWYRGEGHRLVRRWRHYDGQQQPARCTKVLPARLAAHRLAHRTLVARGTSALREQRPVLRHGRASQPLPCAGVRAVVKQLHERIAARQHVGPDLVGRRRGSVLHWRPVLRHVLRTRDAVCGHRPHKRTDGRRWLRPELQSLRGHVRGSGRRFHHGHVDPGLRSDEQHDRRDRGVHRPRRSRVVGRRIWRFGSARVLRSAAMGPVHTQIRRHQELPVHLRRSAPWRRAGRATNPATRHHSNERAHRLAILERAQEDRRRRRRHVGHIQGLDRDATSERGETPARREGHSHDDRDGRPRRHQRTASDLID